MTLFLGNQNIQPDARALRTLLALGNTTPDTLSRTIYTYFDICDVHCEDTFNFFAGPLCGADVGTSGAAQYNIGVGAWNFSDMTTADYNVALGTEIMYDAATVPSGAHNVGLGRYPLYYLSTGSYNIGANYQALYHCTTGQHNVALGVQAMMDLTSGSYNVGLGYRPMYDSVTASYNVAIGRRASDVVNAPYNVGIGYRAAIVSSGQYNVGLGCNSMGAGAVTGDYNIGLGYDSTLGNNAQDNQIRVGNDAADTQAQDSFAIYGHTLTIDFGTGNVGMERTGWRGGLGIWLIESTSTVPAGAAADGTAAFYATGAGAEMWVLDWLGNATRISPHDDDGRWVFRSQNEVTNRQLVVDMEALIEAAERLTGRQFLWRTPLDEDEG